MTRPPQVKDHSLIRWSISGLLVLSLHAGLAAWALHDAELVTDAMPSGAIAIELAPVDVARADLPPNVAPGPEQVQSAAAPPTERVKEEEPKEQPQPQPERADTIPELVKAPDPDPEIPAEPKKEKVADVPVQAAPPPSAEQTVTSAPQVEAVKKDVVAAASSRGVEGPKRTVSLPTWTSNMLNLLERNKRYPAAARSRQEQGTAQILFAIDRQGRLLSAELQKTSGSTALDAEALEMMQRAAPFPPPPPELAGERVVLTVPIKFRIR